MNTNICREMYINYDTYLRSRGYDKQICQLVTDLNYGLLPIGGFTFNGNNSANFSGSMTISSSSSNDGKLLVTGGSNNNISNFSIRALNGLFINGSFVQTTPNTTYSGDDIYSSGNVFRSRFHNFTNSATDVSCSVIIDGSMSVGDAIFTGSVSGLNKKMVDLGNVDNTKDADKEVSTAQQAAIDLKQDDLELSSGTSSKTITVEQINLSNADGSFKIKSNTQQLSLFSNGINGIGFYSSSSGDIDDEAFKMTNDGDLKLMDGHRIIMGDNNDLQIYHDVSNTYLETNGENITFTSRNNVNMCVLNKDDSVQLYYNGNEKLATENDGVVVKGTIKPSYTSIPSNFTNKIGDIIYATQQASVLIHNATTTVFSHTIVNSGIYLIMASIYLGNENHTNYLNISCEIIVNNTVIMNFYSGHQKPNAEITFAHVLNADDDIDLDCYYVDDNNMNASIYGSKYSFLQFLRIA